MSEHRDLFVKGRSYVQSHAHTAEERLSTSGRDRRRPLWLHKVTTEKSQQSRSKNVQHQSSQQ